MLEHSLNNFDVEPGRGVSETLRWVESNINLLRGCPSTIEKTTLGIPLFLESIGMRSNEKLGSVSQTASDSQYEAFPTPAE